jgi:hypothetical protein
MKSTRSLVARALKKGAHAGTSSSRTWFVNNYSFFNNIAMAISAIVVYF